MADSPEKRRVIVAGFGPVGRVLVDRLEACGAAVTLIELNPDTVFKQNQLGRHAVLGDASDVEVLTNAGILTADSLLLTIPDEEAALRACQAARQLAPKIYIAARTNFVSRGLLASTNGADYVVVEELVTAQAMSEAAAEHFMGSAPAGDFPAASNSASSSGSGSEPDA